MAVTLRHKRSDISGSLPSTSDVELGELAVNTFDGKIHFKKSDGNGDAIVTLGPVSEYNLAINNTPLSNSSSNNLSGVLRDLDGAINRNKTFEIGADDSTIRTVNPGETVSFLGDNGVTTASDAEGNITISGPDLGGLNIDTSNNYIGINQTSPEVTLHMTGEGAQSTQIRMEQYNNTADAPDIRSRRYRGTVASPSAVQSGDLLFRSNHEYYNGTGLVVGGAFAFDNTNNAARTQFSVAVDTDGTGANPSGNNGQFKIDGNDGGAITFNNAYKFPTSDGANGQVLVTNGNGTLSWTTLSGGGGPISLDALSDVSASSPTTGQVLKYNGTEWTAQEDTAGDPSSEENYAWHLIFG